MGTIRSEVRSDHLRRFPRERDLIERFLSDFDITWATRRSAHGSSFSVYVLRPDEETRTAFGLGLEVALFLFDYPTVEARTLQAILQVMQESPLRGRVEPGLYFLIARPDSTQEWISDYMLRNPQPKAAIPISFGQLREPSGQSIRELIARFVYRRDLFDFKLPIDSDAYFFGRDLLVSEIGDQIKKGQNAGIFGLRKNGKTSVLYKIRRDAEFNESATIIYMDCKNPLIRKKKATELISYVNREIASKCGIAAKRYASLDPYEAFGELVRLGTRKKPLCLMFDEIEFISPVAKLDLHWHVDFIDLWQLIWSTQSENTGLSFVIGGVNPSICEEPQYQGVQNPLFSIVNVQYMSGLDNNSLANMIRYFGGQMGLSFSEDAISLLFRHYGGHPLLTRMACSFVHKRFESENSARPVDVTAGYFEKVIVEVDDEISAYCAHVVSELKEFYPDEYDILMMAAVGLKSDFADYGRENDLTKHLRSYGVLRASTGDLPEVSLPVLKGFLARDYSRREKVRIPRQLVSNRGPWVIDICSRILRDMRSMLQALPDKGSSPFKSRGVPDSDLLTGLAPATDRKSFDVFISAAYRVFYENVARSLDNTSSFSTTFAAEWPYFYDVLKRIKAYRDYHFHIEVSDKTRMLYEHYAALDIGAENPADHADGWFALQQAVLDELLYAIQAETAKRGT